MKQDPYVSNVKCQKCWKSFPHDYWMYVNAIEHPEVVDKIISGELFVFTCPDCGINVHLDYPILFEDSLNKVIIKYTNAYDADEYAADLISHPEIKKEGYQYRIVEKIDDFREKVMIFHCGLDDRVIEMEKHYNILYRIKYNRPDEEIKAARFDFMDKNNFKLIYFGKKTYSASFDKAFYERKKDIRFKDEKHNWNSDYIVNQAWVEKYWDEYEKNYPD